MPAEASPQVMVRGESCDGAGVSITKAIIRTFRPGAASIANASRNIFRAETPGSDTGFAAGAGQKCWKANPACMRIGLPSLGG